MRYGLWLVVAWVTPAAIAGGLGWTGVWGSSNAFADYISPLPISGGFLHVMTLVVVTALLATQPWSGRLAGYTRGVFLGVSLVGLAMLLDLGKLHVAATTDTVLHGLPWQQNPLGLFLLTDSLLAQLFLAAFEGEPPEEGRKWLTSLALAVCAPLLYALVAVMADPRRDQPFTYAGARPGPQHSDETVSVFTRLQPGTDAFRQAAVSVAEKYAPRVDVTAEDVAVYFFTSLDAARSFRNAEAKATYCMYEDGTPPRFLPGSGDCFKDHESFHEKLMRARAAQDPKLHTDVVGFLATVEACRDRKPIQMPPNWPDNNNSTRFCDGIEKKRLALQQQFGMEQRTVELLGAAR